MVVYIARPVQGSFNRLGIDVNTDDHTIAKIGSIFDTLCRNHASLSPTRAIRHLCVLRFWKVSGVILGRHDETRASRMCGHGRRHASKKPPCKTAAPALTYDH